MRYHAVFLGEWVRVRNLMHGRIRADRPCSICRTAKCAPVWYSIKTKEVRCLKCFDAEGEHWERELQRPLLHRAGGELPLASFGMLKASSRRCSSRLQPAWQGGSGLRVSAG